MLNEIVEDAKSGMEKSLGALETAFKKIRTGRATPSLLDSIKLDYYDKPTPLSQVASISIEDAKTLAIVPWEKGGSATNREIYYGIRSRAKSCYIRRHY